MIAALTLSLQLLLVLSLIYPVLVLGLAGNKSNNNYLILKKPALLNPISYSMIDNRTGNLKNSLDFITKIYDRPAQGTIADGVSKLLLVVLNYSKPLESSLKANDTNVKGAGGTLSSLSKESSTTKAATTTILINPQKNSTGQSIVVAVYTPPTYVDPPVGANLTTIKVQVRDIADPHISTEIPVQLYRVPVIQVHGIWTNAVESWSNTGFKEALLSSGLTSLQQTMGLIMLQHSTLMQNLRDRELFDNQELTLE